MEGKRYICDDCGQEYAVDVVVRVNTGGAVFCPFCGSSTPGPRLFPPGSGVGLDNARCFTSIQAPREIKRLLWVFWQERAAIRAKYPTLVTYITAIMAGGEPLPTDES